MGRERSAFIPWRSEAALAHAVLGETEKGRRLAHEEVELTRAYGAPGQLGISLRALGLVAGTDGIDLLRDSVAACAASPLRIELAMSLLELGAALRRTGRRRDALDPLRGALDVAAQCGAAAIAERARGELALAGARPGAT